MNHFFDFEVSLQCWNNLIAPEELSAGLQMVPIHCWDNTMRPKEKLLSKEARTWRYYAVYGFPNRDNISFEEFLAAVSEKLRNAYQILRRIGESDGVLQLYTTIYSRTAFVIDLAPEIMAEAARLGIELQIEYIPSDRKRPNNAETKSST